MVQKSPVCDVFKIRFGETIDEYCVLVDLDLPKANVVEVDFRNVQAINSLGIKNLIKYFRYLGKEQTVVFRNCSVSFIHQIKLFPSLLTLSDAEIHSFALPYYCEYCSLSKDVFVKLQIVGEISDVDCADCGRAMELQEEKDEYLSFLRAA